MAKYAAKFTHATVSSSFKTAGHVRAPGSGMRRGKIYDLLLGASGTPADNVLEFNIARTTANGTDGSTVTPVALDPADAAAVSTVGQGVTVEPTVTASSDLWDLNLNQRASYRWVAAPGGELVFPATANNGLAIRVLSPGYTNGAGGAVHFEEQ